ncbi:protein kinase domain-containing protein [Malaciobacter marinus]|uniref:protein kinase domain-containing protein n=1 Tax=Malaciobacter marinus TaxID=505249 RepID=UPI0018C87A1C|nr:protein kinase [Malaciobacter marinus]
MSNHIEIFINNKSNQIPSNDIDYINDFLPFYADVKNDNIAYLFAYYHYKFNSLFNFMNSKLNSDNHHYNADPSRELIAIIDDLESVSRELKNTKYNFNIDTNYLETIKLCKTFLLGSGGSPIPDNFKKVSIIEAKPIFHINSTITVENVKLGLKLIGEGSYAQVLKYKDKFYNKTFALKRAKHNLNEKELERFRREYESMKSLNSPYILEVYNFDEKEKSYIMEYADFTLANYIKEYNTKLAYNQRKNIINQTFKAFEYLQSKDMLHRDISVNNILLKQYDDLLVVKISDFGLVKLKGSDLTSQNTEYKGSLNDPKLDIVGGFKNYEMHHETYALTRLVYFILTGKIRIDNYKKSEQLETFIKNGISDNIDLRYHSIKEMRKAFNDIVL